MKPKSFRMFRLLALAIIIAVVAAPPLQTQAAAADTDRPWMNTSLSAEERTELLLKAMTLEDKVSFVTGNLNNYYGFYNAPLEKYGIPALQMADGPAGVRIANPDIQDKKSTSLPAPIALAATWDTDAAKRYGDLLGDEAYNTTHNVLLGPGFDIARMPWGARNFESLGEDPLLQSELGVSYVSGVQSHPVIATAKHFLLNNQETERFTINSEASERAIEEVYMRPFAAAVEKANLGAAMCSFNKVNGVAACDNKTLMTDILKKQLGFKGFIMSDYGANMSTVESALAGLDLETPGEPNGKWGSHLLEAVKNGQVSEAQIDEMASRILLQMFDKGLFDHPAQNNQIPAQQHGAVARELAEEGMVLLQNNKSQLPLNSSKLKSIAVIGPDADNASAAGGGSSLVNPTYTVSPLEGIKNRAGDKVKVNYEPGTDPITAGDILAGPSAVPSSVLSTEGTDSTETGLHGEYWTNTNLEGEPELVRTDAQVNLNLGFYNFGGFNAQSPKVSQTPGNLNGQMSARWTGNITAPSTGDYVLTLTSLGSSKLYLDDQLLIDRAGKTLDTSKATVSLKAGESHSIKIEYRTDVKGVNGDYGAQVRFGWEAPKQAVESKMEKAVKLAADSDVAVVVVRTYDSEGNTDPSNLDLPNNQDRLIRAVAAANPHTVVVQMSGRAVQTSTWQDQVPSIVQAWFAGQEQGNAIARVLFGDVNPVSCRLPSRWMRMQPLSRQKNLSLV